MNMKSKTPSGGCEHGQKETIACGLEFQEVVQLVDAYHLAHLCTAQ